MFKMSSAAAQKASTKSFQIFSTFAVVDPTQPNLPKTEKSRPNLTHGSTQPMDNSGVKVYFSEYVIFDIQRHNSEKAAARMLFKDVVY